MSVSRCDLAAAVENALPAVKAMADTVTVAPAAGIAGRSIGD